MNRTSLTRRLVAGAAGLTVGVFAALSVATPASAHHPLVEGDPVCDQATGEWVVTWTVTSADTPPGVTEWKLTGTEHTPAETEVAGFVLDTFQSIETPFVATQVLPGDATGATLAAAVEWDNGFTNHDSGEVSFEGTCDAEEFIATFDCETVSMTIPNIFDEETTFEVVPSEGEPVEVTLGPDEVSEGEVTFPVFAGLTVDILVEGESILEEPFEFTEEDLEGLDCDRETPSPQPPAPGEGGGLPETGAPTLLIAGGAGALLLLGAGLFMMARRRRVTFTA